VVVSAKSLVLNLLSSLRGRAMPVRALVGAAGVFGIADETMRVALARLLAGGMVQRDERGLYRLAGKTRAVQSEVESWTDIEQRLVPWSGAWVAVHTAGLPRSDRKAGRRRGRAFDFLGFRELEPGLWIRPDNLRGGVAAARRRLQALGLEDTAPVFRITELGPAQDRAAQLWRVDELRDGYRRVRADLERSAARLPKLARSRAMVESFVLGGKAIRGMVFDPLLPEPLVPVAERRALLEELKRYDKLGRQCWREFMKEQGAPHIEAPLDFGFRETAGKARTFPAAEVSA
jgi:phenylacetic acid degradation operon negative regulatory protein